MHGAKIKQFFQTHYPSELAYDWDNVGLQIGTLNKDITGILITLDVTKAVVEEAIKKNSNLIIAHHPLVFKPLKAILSDAYKGQVIEMMIKNDIALYVSHTNFDLANAGMNDFLSEKLKLKNIEILEYEDETHGIGRIGDIKPMKLMDAIAFIKDNLKMKQARLITNKKNKTIKRLAISGGSGASHMFSAKQKGADLYITGDISYHQAHDILQLGLNALDIGHYVEKHFMESLKEKLQSVGITAPLYTSQIDQDPFLFV